MELQHTFTVPVGIDEAWTTFNDLERIAPCFPGAEITSVDGDDFTGLAKVRLGPISLQYTGTGRWLERDRDGYRAVIEASGKDKRGNGTAAATITAHLEPDGDGTRVVVDTDLRITGRPAQFGRGVIQDVGNKLLDQFASCLATTLGPQPEPAPTGEPAKEQPTGDQPVPAAAPSPAPSGSSAPPGPASSAPPRPPAELDLGAVVGPALARRYGPVVLAVTVAAVLTWWIARRRSR